TFGLTADEVERQIRAIYFGQVATQVPESSLRMTDVRVRYSDALRFGSSGFDQDLVRNQWILAPEGNVHAKAGSDAQRPASLRALAGLARAIPLNALAQVTPKRSPDEQTRENQQPAIFVTAELAPG